MNRRDFLHVAALPVLASTTRGILKPASADTASTAFDRSMVRQMASDAASKPFKAPDTRLPDNLKNLDYDHYRAIRFLPERALWRDQKLPFRGPVFPSRLLLCQPRRHLRSRQRPGEAHWVSARPLFVWRYAAAQPHGRSGIFRLSPSCGDQPAGLLGRSLRLSWRQLFPRRRERARSMGSPRGAFRSTPAMPRARSFPSSRPSGSRSPRLTHLPSSCMRCWTAKAPRPPIASPSGPAIPRYSMWKWPSIRGSIWTMPASRR